MSPDIPEPVEATEPMNRTVPQVEFVKPIVPNGRPASKPRGAFARAMLGPDKEPKKTLPKPPREKTKGTRGAFVKPLEELYTAGGMMLMPFDQPCGKSVIQQAHACAVAMDELAYENETVRRILEGVISTSVVGKVIAAHAPILITLMMHHSPAMQARMSNGFGDFVENAMKVQPNDES